MQVQELASSSFLFFFIKKTFIYIIDCAMTIVFLPNTSLPDYICKKENQIVLL